MLSQFEVSAGAGCALPASAEQRNMPVQSFV